MPGKKRRFGPGLIQRLRDEPHRFEFFQAVRLLLMHHRQQSQSGDRDVLGGVIRFRSSTSLAFPPSEIEALEFEWKRTENEGREGGADGPENDAQTLFSQATLTPSFIGLTGPSGVLPRHYTQHVAEREMYHRDTATHAFLDIFTNRAVALFYLSWTKYRLHLQYEADRKNRFLPMVLSFAGLGLPGIRNRLQEAECGFRDESLAYFSAALRERPASVQWFSRVVSDYFNVACGVEQFVGQWFVLPERERSVIGAGNCVLGQSAMCGDRVWDRQSKVRLILGPMRKAQFDEFLPGAAGAVGLERFFRLMVGPTFDCEVRLVLDRRDVAPAALGGEAEATRLGWNGWFKSRDIWSDARDTAYLISAGGAF